MKELHRMITSTRALAPPYTMAENTQTINNDQGVLWTPFNLLLRDFLPVIRAETRLGICINILPDILLFYYTRAWLAAVTKVHNKSQFEEGRCQK
jgi:hypothetical protein